MAVVEAKLMEDEDETSGQEMAVPRRRRGRTSGNDSKKVAKVVNNKEHRAIFRCDNCTYTAREVILTLAYNLRPNF